MNLPVSQERLHAVFERFGARTCARRPGNRFARLPLHKKKNSFCPRLRSLASGDGEDVADDSSSDLDLARSSLEGLLEPKVMSGNELWALIKEKWGRSYDVRITKRGSRAYFQVMWKFLEQQSFPLTSEEYLDQLDAVASLLTEWGVTDVVRKGVVSARERGPGYTHGGGARAISIPLDVDLSGMRSGEWH
ncbi:hypothetical protein BSKO_09394 [Bryopsis sp. KO-2023]|nr:hypothetical protein BSKO_09394 [Bryopsis sp. KO-2023]